jgi:HSP20 family protein
MNLIQWRPYQSLLDSWPDVWEDDFLHDSNQRQHLNIYEKDNQVVVEANVAGVKADQIDLSFNKGVLWIKAEAEKEEGHKDKKHYSKANWSYSYKVAVPGQIDQQSEPQAELSKGILKIKFKKQKIAEPKKLKIAEKND